MAVSPIKIILQASGSEEVIAALKSVKDAMVELEAASTKAVSQASKQRIKIIHEEMNEREKSLKHTAKVESDISRALGKTAGTRRATVGSNTSSSFGSDSGGGLSSLFSGSEFSGLAKLGTVAGAAGAAFAVFKKGLDMATDALKAFGGFVLQDVIQPQLKRETSAQQIANASMGQLSAKEILSSTRATALKHNIDQEEQMRGMNEFQDLTGQPKLALEIGDPIAMVSKARGIPSSDAYKLAAAAYASGDTAEDIQNKLLKMTAQGDSGSIPLKDIARLGPKLKKITTGFSGTSQEKYSKSNALIQSSRIGSPEETMTASEEFMLDVIKEKRIKSKKFIKKGAEGQEITDFGGLMGEIYGKENGDVGKYAKKHKLSKGSFEILNAQKDTYDEAYKSALAAGNPEKEAREKAAKAVTDHIHEIENATMSYAQAAEEEKKVLQTGGEKWDAAMRKIKDKLLDVMPGVQGFIDKFSAAAPQLAESALIMAKALVAGANMIAGALKLLFPTLKGPDDTGSSKINAELAGAKKDKEVEDAFKADAALKVDPKTGSKYDFAAIRKDMESAPKPDQPNFMPPGVGKQPGKDGAGATGTADSKIGEVISNGNALAKVLKDLADSGGQLNRSKSHADTKN